MRVMILGARGQLGRELAACFGALHEVTGCDLPEFDITNREQVFETVVAARPELVVNAAAYTDVERAESEPDLALRCNAAGAGHAAAAAASVGAPVMYYSTDFVFDGTSNAPYSEETAFPDLVPLSTYGRTKLMGESATRSENPNHFVIRTAWLYGPGGNNFVEKILAAAKARPELRVVSDEIGCPTHTWDLAQATVALCRTAAPGTYHFVNGGSCSRFDFARAALELAEIGTPVQPCLAAEFPTAARRPARAVLSTDKYTRATGLTPRPWREALARYIQRRETGT
jgi:dTDP-4-dehydrorhamnose reductase